MIQPQDPINIKAAERMGKLHDQLKAIGFEGRPLELYLVRLLFSYLPKTPAFLKNASFRTTSSSALPTTAVTWRTAWPPCFMCSTRRLKNA